MTLGRNLAPLVCYYRIKLPFKAEPVLSGLHTIREHRSFQRLHTLLVIVLARSQPSPGHSKGDAGGEIQKGASRLFSYPGEFGSKGKRPLSREESFSDSRICGKEEQKVRAGSNEREGGAGCDWGVLGFLLSRGMLTLAHWGPSGWGSRQVATVHRLGSGVQLAPITTPQVQQQLGISRQCADGKRAGLSLELQPCPWGVPNPGDPSLL